MPRSEQRFVVRKVCNGSTRSLVDIGKRTESEASLSDLGDRVSSNGFPSRVANIRLTSQAT